MIIEWNDNDYSDIEELITCLTKEAGNKVNPVFILFETGPLYGGTTKLVSVCDSIEKIKSIINKEDVYVDKIEGPISLNTKVDYNLCYHDYDSPRCSD